MRTGKQPDGRALTWPQGYIIDGGARQEWWLDGNFRTGRKRAMVFHTLGSRRINVAEDTMTR